MSTETPKGERFSHVYLQRGTPTDDSKRMRRRIGHQIYEIPHLAGLLVNEVEKELGIPVPYPSHWANFLETIELRDFLDLVTVASNLLRNKRLIEFQRRWLLAVQRIFIEENVHYRVDAEGGVHFHPDAEYAHNRAAVIGALQSARYANALDAFERGTAALSNASPDGKRAIREVFSAAEGIFRLLMPDTPRLAAGHVDKLVPIVEQRYTGDETARRATMKMLNSFKDWIDAAHFYRHEEGKEEVAQPPLQLAVYLVSTGAAHIRWLAELDAK